TTTLALFTLSLHDALPIWAGTENVQYIVGLAAALTRMQARRSEHTALLEPMRQRLTQGILSAIQRTQLTGHPTRRLPHNASFVRSEEHTSELQSPDHLVCR